MKTFIFDPKEVMRRFNFSILLFLLSIASIGGCTETDQTSNRGLGEAAKVGYRAPNFRLNDLDGNERSLAEFKGKVVFINFWATWCVPCKAEMPSMEALYRDYKEEGLEVLAISNDLQGEPVVRPFVEEMELTYTILLDSDFRVDDKYLVHSVPTSFIIGRDGIVTHELIGARNWNAPEAREMIENLLRMKLS